MNEKVGFYGGKFCPIPHLGHVYAMTVASTLVDELHVIVSYDEEYEREVLYKNSEVEYINYKQRVRWWKQLTKNMSHVKVHSIYEKQTNKFTDWEIGSEKIKEVVGKPIDVVFSSEYEYEKYFNILYPSAEHILIDPKRVNYNISGTKIRKEGIINNWEMIPNVVKPYFVKKVVVVGTESSGKSSLVQNLANIYNTNYIEEFGRTFYDRLGDYDTLESDFPEIAYEHQYRIKKGLEKSNKVMFIDTETIVTQNFSMAYEGKRMSVLDEIAKLQDYDLWLFLEPDVKWVDDGTRIFGEDSVRDKMTKNLKKLLKENNVEYISIGGGYKERLDTAIKEVDKVLTEGVNEGITL